MTCARCVGLRHGRRPSGIGAVGMDGDGAAFVAGLRTCFAELHDPRVQERCDHTLLDIVAITLLASMCGADDWPEVEVFGRKREPWRRTFLELPNGIPSHDTFGRVFMLIDPEAFEAGFTAWAGSLMAGFEREV